MASRKLDIQTYNRKRDFSKTKEPKGRKLKGKGDSFVVQKHDASRLHWDFRLELDGVLKSWAVPKGPSLDPDDKRLAVRTEDHPLDYGEFEGVIPKGEYGGGTVMLWDKGRWEPEPGKDPSKTIEEGHLHFTLDGERMKGEWVMFRLKPKPGERQEPWMLKKVDDDFAKPDEGEALVEQCVTSVTTDRSMAEIAAAADVWHSNRKATGKTGRAKRKTGVGPPPFQAPQLATLVDEVPAGSDWLHEYKYDGYRLLVSTAGGAATAWTRNGNDWSDKFRSIVRAAAKLPPGCLIDGEAVALDKKGKPSFQLLQATLKGGDAELAYYAFDLLVDQGEDITGLPNIERKERLAALLKPVSPPILYGDHVIGKGEKLFDAICKEGGEGVISKKAEATYAGKRSKNWLKIKCIQRQEFVIVGWQDSDKRKGFRSLHLAARDGRKLKYAGKVGTGFDTKMIQDLRDRMEPMEIHEPAVDVPRSARRSSHWIEPKLVAEVAFTEFTRDATLRHPSFIALREDKPAREVVLEKPKKLSTVAKSKKADAASDSFGIEISNPDRVIYPGDGLTKGDLAAYYAAVESLMLVDMAKRPISLVRCPQGRAKQCFFQKHDSGAMGPHVKHVPIEESDGDVADYLYVQDAKGILACVQMGTIEFHGWGSRVAKLEYPDRLVFDLDPDEGLDFKKVKEAALRLRALLADLGLVTFPLLTGGKGIHVIAPLDRSADWPKVKSFAERFSRAIAEAEPDTFTANIRKNQRKGRIFLDWLRNQRGATAIMPYSARARDGAPVAAPIAWEELEKVKSGATYSIRDADELIERASSKQLAGWGEAMQKLPKA
ncbi:DNA ligase D [Sphingomonas sp. NSE70-1]|uniref:DNA ligase (ATP) n=1 Tax=Sphingomonas caseinilyticus TaxID=2908205 RepID=A0ABT0RW95_9SPHN|nr:DNA ligase D [Sphingomonas caseinilyticus]MCL6699287.1 DNA ligase D [Sphingomonas caseinilyticus]